MIETTIDLNTGKPSYRVVHPRMYSAAELESAVAAERERWRAACDAERAEFVERASNNDGSRESDFAFGSVNSSERIKAAVLGPNGKLSGGTPSA